MSFPKTFYRWRPHPWHGLGIGSNAPDVVNAYIEMTPFDAVKYEVDKATGYLRVDRPQLTSSMAPTLYGFVPQTYCGARVQAMSPTSEKGDGDPLDICVITERPINRGEVILRARVIGGVQMVDGGEADDKIIAVLHGSLLARCHRRRSDSRGPGGPVASLFRNLQIHPQWRSGREYCRAIW